jgi:hypothetical protein
MCCALASWPPLPAAAADDVGWDVMDIAICEMEGPCLRAQWRDYSAFRVTGTRGARVLCVHLHYCTVPIGAPICRMAAGQPWSEKRLVFAVLCASWGSSRGVRVVLVFSPFASPRLG